MYSSGCSVSFPCCHDVDRQKYEDECSLFVRGFCCFWLWFVYQRGSMWSLVSHYREGQSPPVTIWAVRHFITGLLMLCVAHRHECQAFLCPLFGHGTFYSAVMKCFRDSNRSLICIQMHHADDEDMLSVLSVYLNVFSTCTRMCFCIRWNKDPWLVLTPVFAMWQLVICMQVLF